MGFMFAPQLHGAMKFAVPVRKEIGIRTVFNVLGPLTNPAGARRQVMGVYAADLVRPIAEVLLRLGAEHALVVHAADGLDEITLSGFTQVCEVRGGAITCYELSPEVLGLPVVPLDDIRAETAAESAAAIRSVLAGDKGPRRDIVLANAGGRHLRGRHRPRPARRPPPRRRSHRFRRGPAGARGAGRHVAQCHVMR